ncbi:hypothetical protein RJT34_13356 [Clitoria ternatea]|uniref:Uncharacterized protein n=1 Tax=Clitoria ternatea TaxID=43366 RepID=A0AAN9PLC9_CLITE
MFVDRWCAVRQSDATLSRKGSSAVVVMSSCDATRWLMIEAVCRFAYWVFVLKWEFRGRDVDDDLSHYCHGFSTNIHGNLILQSKFEPRRRRNGHQG